MSPETTEQRHIEAMQTFQLYGPDIAMERLVLEGWRERIAKAEASDGKFTREDRALASCWLTCAVGEQQLRMPEVQVLMPSGDGVMPGDLQLTKLGSFSHGFTHAVFIDDVAGAARFLDSIEDRALELKREQGAPR